MAKTKQDNLKFATKAVHGGQEPEKETGAVSVPIFATSTYINNSLGESKGYDYGRTINPTRSALERALAVLENGKFAYCFSSGMSAVHCLMNIFEKGDHIVCSDNVYGGTYRLYEQVMRKFGLDFTYVDTSDISAVENAIKENTKLIYVETPTNPMLGISDLEKINTLAKKKKNLTCVDNTFMSPYFQNPLDFGIDIVLHSSTKYISGHCDVIGGCIITSLESIAEKIKFLQNSIGAVPSPFDCFLLLRSVKTLPLRMEKHNENAMAIAEYLEGNHKVKKLYYPGLKSHPNHHVAAKQTWGFGGIISIDLSSYENAAKFCNALEIFQIAESLGGIESLVCHPPSMTHGSIPKEMREKIGLNDGLVRLSVGIEDKEDLINDIKNSLDKV